MVVNGLSFSVALQQKIHRPTNKNYLTNNAELKQNFKMCVCVHMTTTPTYSV